MAAGAHRFLILEKTCDWCRWLGLAAATPRVGFCWHHLRMPVADADATSCLDPIARLILVFLIKIFLYPPLLFAALLHAPHRRSARHEPGGARRGTAPRPRGQSWVAPPRRHRWLRQMSRRWRGQEMYVLQLFLRSRHTRTRLLTAPQNVHFLPSPATSMLATQWFERLWPLRLHGQGCRCWLKCRL